jgi:hypothetical protein
MRSSAPTKTNCAPSTCAISCKDGQETPKPLGRLILAGPEIAHFADPQRPYHPRDLGIALDIDRYDFAIRVVTEDGRPVARVE